jgi:flavin reductase (DIM6/NTAB) family NADH-FMN oxidoreductase RutF
MSQTAEKIEIDTKKALRNALGHFATGVTIVTANTPEGPVGITVNSFSSVSLDPALTLWSIDRKGNRYDTFANAQHYAIHILSAEQKELAFAIAKDMRNFGDSKIHLSEAGVPIIEGCIAVFECSQTARYPGGDHDIILGEIQAYETFDGPALGFYKGQAQVFDLSS